jgi:hypothetical protein
MPQLADFSLSDAMELAAKGQNPRIHPNGFIQLDLEDVESGDWTQTHHRGHSGANLRLHIWNPPNVELPRQKTVNEVHDHVFDMKSHVIFGTLEQQLFKLMEPNADHPATHERYQAVYAKSAESRLEPTGQLGWLRLYSKFPISTGQSYTQPAFTLHNSVPLDGCVITVMQKTEIHDGDAYAICDIGSPPDNSFVRDQAMDKDELYNVIVRTLRYAWTAIYTGALAPIIPPR